MENQILLDDVIKYFIIRLHGTHFSVFDHETLKTIRCIRYENKIYIEKIKDDNQSI